jgi:glutaredoxin 3
MRGRSAICLAKQQPAPNAKEKLFDELNIKERNTMATKKKIEVFSAGCSTCKETIEVVKRLAGSSHEVVIHDMQKSEVASKAKQYGVRSVPAVVIDGKLAGCCAGRGPDEHVLRSALA